MSCHLISLSSSAFYIIWVCVLKTAPTVISSLWKWRNMWCYKRDVKDTVKENRNGSHGIYVALYIKIRSIILLWKPLIPTLCCSVFISLECMSARGLYSLTAFELSHRSSLIICSVEFICYSVKSVNWKVLEDKLLQLLILAHIFVTFQDTVLGLQAMSEYGAIMTGNLNLDVDVTSGNFSQNIHIDRSDAMVLKLIEVCHGITCFYDWVVNVPFSQMKSFQSDLAP